MKLINYNEFIKLPPGYIYSTYEDGFSGEPMVKKESIKDIDWFYSELTNNIDYDSDIFEAMKELESGKQLEFNFDIQQRDGMFDNNRRFIIYSNKDVQMFIAKLSESLNIIDF